MSVLPSPDTFAAASVNVGQAAQRLAVTNRPGFMARLIAAYRERARRRTVIGELNMLSDRELADIGIERGDLGRVFDADFARGRFVG